MHPPTHTELKMRLVKATMRHSQSCRLGGSNVVSSIQDTEETLERAHVHFFLERTWPDTVRGSAATFAEERWEIDVFEDDHLEISRFRGNETAEGGMELLLQHLPTEAATKPT